jgi:glycerol-3-phosphate dehydrogenase (NAD(P)+)
MNRIGIIGAGNFGTALGKVLQKNGNEILFYVRTPRDLEYTTTSLEQLFDYCKIIFIVVPVENIPELLAQIKNFLKPYHFLIHCIKGLVATSEENFCRENIFTVSELIKKILNHNYIGCLSGPNLANEIKNFQLTSTVIASEEQEMSCGVKSLLMNEKFVVYESRDIVGVEMCGVVKNIIALASGILNGLGEGDNAKSLLVTLGLQEMMQIVKIFTEVEEKTFYGVAGIGDLIATCSSMLSRNFTVGNRVAQGEKFQNLLSEGITAEGVNTTFLIYRLACQKNINIPITKSVYEILFEDADPTIIKTVFS